MTEHGWQDVKEIFLNALEKDAEERESFLDEVCNGDGSQRAELESLLKSHFEVEGFIETPAFKIGEVFDGGTVARDQQFGNYTIIREIGVGGMGAVFLAKRSDGEFDQMVAIKIVRQAIAESHLIDRFKRERQILAPLNHPNIARLLDGGVSQNGQPFLAMEYVEGDTITRFSEQQDLSIREKIILFLKVCSAVSYAHRNLIVHRDLKPNNILVTADGEPKLLDFGLAKLLDASLNSDAEQTQTAFRALTPAYASPEQLRGEPITTASDIYSLGVVLFELLTGERPLKTDGKSLEEIIRTATEFEPTLPSRSTPSGAQLKGDLDNIALTALRREPERRYRSVEQFSDDLERYLDGRPVSARPNTFRYRASKFVQRNRIVVAAASLILAIITVGVGTTIWQARQTRKEKEKAENINTFLEQTLRYSNPILSPLKKSGQDTTVNEVLDEAARRLESGEFDHDPELKIELERTVATTLLGQGQYLRGRRHMAEYVALLRQVYSENDPKFVIGMTYSAGLLFAKGEMVEAEALYRQNLPTLRTEVTRGTINPGVLADALNNFA